MGSREGGRRGGNIRKVFIIIINLTPGKGGGWMEKTLLAAPGRFVAYIAN